MAQNQDDKVQTILYAAFDAFAKYGFKRTSMADIAEGADMSRAALYLHFKNKNDIFRALIESYYALCCRDAATALSTPASVTDQLQGAFVALTGEAYKALLDSPHGDEILDLKSAAKETVRYGMESVAQIFAQWLKEETANGRLDFAVVHEDPLEVAYIMLKSLDGLKADIATYQQFSDRRKGLATLFGRALARS